jgi:hypothetical protein
VQLNGVIAQSEPCTIANRDASVTAYSSVVYVHMPREISMTEIMSNMMGMPATANSNNTLPLRDFRYIQFALVAYVAYLVIVFVAEGKSGAEMGNAVWYVTVTTAGALAEVVTVNWSETDEQFAGGVGNDCNCFVTTLQAWLKVGLVVVA